MRRVLVAAALSVLVTGGAAVTGTTAAARPVPRAASCGGVWVVVDYGSLGGVSTQCATSYGTGLAALRSAGFNPTISEGFIDKINGKPGKPDSSVAYWSYWHATRNDDGSYSGWSYSNLGANAYHPTKGNAEGWRFQSLGGGNVPPGAKPPTDAGTPTPKPTPTKTTTKPTPKPSSSRKPSTSTPTATKPATVAASNRATTKAATTAAAPASAAAKESAPATTTPATSASTAAESAEASGVAAGTVQAQAEPASASEPAADSGTPVGLIATAGIVVLAGAGLGGWWWLKGRKS